MFSIEKKNTLTVIENFTDLLKIHRRHQQSINNIYVISQIIEILTEKIKFRLLGTRK